MVAHTVDIRGFHGEVEFLWERGFDFIRQPFEGVFGKKEFDVVEGKAR